MLAADVAALRTQPPADVSAMDGYAVRAADVANVPAHAEGRSAKSRPAIRSTGAVGAGEAARIFTGGVLPAGADTVVIQEITDARRRPRHRHTADRHGPQRARRRASISRKATCCCARAAASTDRDLMLAAAMNHPALPVHRRPKVAVLGTGDELVPPGSDARTGRDRLFQRLRAAGAGAREGAEVDDLGIAPRPRRGHRRCRAPRARLRRRYPGHNRRRLGRRARSGAERARAPKGSICRSGAWRCGRAGR